MSRSGYSDDCDDSDCLPLALYRQHVERAIRGKRGQAFLHDMAAALDAMPVKELIAGEIVRDREHVCAMGSVAVARRLDVSDLDVTDRDAVARVMGIAPSLAAEIAYQNDDDNGYINWGKGEETPAQRWKRMRSWVESQIRRVQP